MEWLDNNVLLLRTILIASVCNASCAILGCYLVLRRMSLIGDAISHAVLPGLVLAFVFSGGIHGPAMVIGAIIIGLLTAFLTLGIKQVSGVSEDAGMGVVFTSLFSIGVILITRLARQVDLDPDCVLHGQLEQESAGNGWEITRSLENLVLMLLITIGFVCLLWKELKLTSFDPAIASAMGFRVGLVHYLLMAMVAGVTVVSFKAVGSILVIAMLIVPAATAHLLTDRFLTMMLLAVGLSLLTSVVGAVAASADFLNTNTAGMMAVVSGLFLGLAVFFAPRHGLIVRWFRRRR